MNTAKRRCKEIKQIPKWKMDCKKLEAAGKIASWYLHRKKINDAIEIKERRLLSQQRKTPQIFTVERLFSEEKRKEFGKEVNAIVEEYFKKGSSIEEDSLEADNQSVWKQIQDGLTIDSILPIVVRNKKGQLQAASLVYRSRLIPSNEIQFELLYIATAPHNLGNSGLYRGAGTAAVEDAVQLCKRWKCKSLLVMRDKAAIPFYEKIGISSNLLPSAEFSAFFAKSGGKARPIL